MYDGHMEAEQTKKLTAQVAEAFGVAPEVVLLPGGIDLKTFRSGDVVLRYLGEGAREVGDWQAALFEQLKEDGFRVAKPIQARNGEWMVDGWIAERFLAGQHATGADVPQVIEAIRHFHVALIGVTPPDYRKRERTIYDRADAWAWREIPEHIDPALQKVIAELVRLRRPIEMTDQLIHGDLNPQNILIADHLPPAIIDLAPYWRPAEFALAVFAFWIGPYEGDQAILEHFSHVKDFDQMLIRAGLRMILTQPDPLHATGIEEYRRAADCIVQFVTLH